MTAYLRWLEWPAVGLAAALLVWPGNPARLTPLEGWLLLVGLALVSSLGRRLLRLVVTAVVGLFALLWLGADP